MTVLHGTLFVSDGAGMINQVDLNTGAVLSSFSTGTVGLNGLGSIGDDLLALDFTGSRVREYSTSGVLLKTIPLVSVPNVYSWNGVASDGTSLYVADADSGNVYKYSTSGVQLGVIKTGLSNLSGLSYDAVNNSLWMTDVAYAGPDEVLDFSTSGRQLSSFSPGSLVPYGGIAVVPVAAPEPASLALVCSALVSLLALPLRRKHGCATRGRTIARRSLTGHS